MTLLSFGACLFTMQFYLRRFPSENCGYPSTFVSAASEDFAMATAPFALSAMARSNSTNSNCRDLADLLYAPPGIDSLAALASIDPIALLPADRIDYLTALERQDGWLYALKQRAIFAVAGGKASTGEGPMAGVDETEREEISSALRVAPMTAQSRIDVARTLVNHLPNTCSALATGEISSAHATAIAKESARAISDGMSEYAIFEMEQKAIAYAEFHTPGQVSSMVRTTIARYAPEEFEEVALKARDARRVDCYPNPDGLSTVVAILPSEGAQIVVNALEAFILHSQQSAEVKSSGGDEVGSDKAFNNQSSIDGSIRDARSADMKRADALIAICSQYLGDPSKSVEAHRRPLTVNVTIDLPTLLGLAENPGQLAGYGPIPASVARQFAADARWKRFITEPQTGNLLDFGRESYEPPQALKDFLIARDRTCRFPGCRRSALLSDLDHAESWSDGGQTSPDNLGALCRRHHRLKTHDGWKVESQSDGSCTWTSPLGKSYFTPARSAHDST